MDSNKDPGGSSSNKWRGIAKKGKRRDVGLFSLTDKQDDDAEKRGTVPYMPSIDRLRKDASKGTPPITSSSGGDETSCHDLPPPTNKSNPSDNTARTVTIASWSSSSSNKRSTAREGLTKCVNKKTRKSFDVMLAQSEDSLISATKSRTNPNKITDQTSQKLKHSEGGSSMSSSVSERGIDHVDKFKSSRTTVAETNSNESDRRFQETASLKVASSLCNRDNIRVKNSSTSNSKKDQRSNRSSNDICAIIHDYSDTNPINMSKLASPNKPKKIRFGYMRPSNWKKDEKYVKKTVVKKCLDFVKLGLSQKGAPPTSTCSDSRATENVSSSQSRSTAESSSDSVSNAVKSRNDLKGTNKCDDSSKIALAQSGSNLSRTGRCSHSTPRDESTTTGSRSSSMRSSRTSLGHVMNERTSRKDILANRRGSLVANLGNTSNQCGSSPSKSADLLRATENISRRKDRLSSRGDSEFDFKDHSLSRKKHGRDSSSSSSRRSPSNRRYSLSDKRDSQSDRRKRSSRSDSPFHRREERSSRRSSNSNRRDSPSGRKTSRSSRADSPSHRKKSYSSGRDSPSSIREGRSSKGNNVTSTNKAESSRANTSLASRSFEAISSTSKPKNEEESSRDSVVSENKLSSKSLEGSNVKRNRSIPNFVAQSRTRSRSDNEKTDVSSGKLSKDTSLTYQLPEASDREPDIPGNDRLAVLSSPELSHSESLENEDSMSLPDIEGSSSFVEKECMSGVMQGRDRPSSTRSLCLSASELSDDEIPPSINCTSDADESCYNSQTTEGGTLNSASDVVSSIGRKFSNMDQSEVACVSGDNNTAGTSINDVPDIANDTTQTSELDFREKQLGSPDVLAKSSTQLVNEGTHQSPSPKKVKLDRKSFNMSDKSKEVLGVILKDSSPTKQVYSTIDNPSKTDFYLHSSALPCNLPGRTPILLARDHKPNQSHGSDEESVDFFKAEEKSKNGDCNVNKLTDETTLTPNQKTAKDSEVKANADMNSSSLSDDYIVPNTTEDTIISSILGISQESSTSKQESLDNNSIDFVNVSAFQREDEEDELSDSVAKACEDPLSESRIDSVKIVTQFESAANRESCARVLRTRHCSQIDTPEAGSTVECDSNVHDGFISQSTRNDKTDLPLNTSPSPSSDVGIDPSSADDSIRKSSGKSSDTNTTKNKRKPSTSVSSLSSFNKSTVPSYGMQCKELFVRLETMDSSRLSEMESKTAAGDEILEKESKVYRESDVDDDSKSIASNSLSVASKASMMSLSSQRRTRSSCSSSSSNNQENPGDERVLMKTPHSRRRKTGSVKTKSSSEDASDEERVEETTEEASNLSIPTITESVKSKSTESCGVQQAEGIARANSSLTRCPEPVKSESADLSEVEQVEDIANDDSCSLNSKTESVKCESPDASDLKNQVEVAEAPSSRSYWMRLEATKTPADYSYVDQAQEVPQQPFNVSDIKAESEKDALPDSTDTKQAHSSCHERALHLNQGKGSIQSKSADPSNIAFAEGYSGAPIQCSRQISDSVEIKTSASSDEEQVDEIAEEPTTRILRRRSESISKLDSAVDDKKTTEDFSEGKVSEALLKKADLDANKSVDGSDAEQLEGNVEKKKKQRKSSLSCSKTDNKSHLAALDPLQDENDYSNAVTVGSTENSDPLITPSCSIPSKDVQKITNQTEEAPKRAAGKDVQNTKPVKLAGRNILVCGGNRRGRFESPLPKKTVVCKSTQCYPILITDDKKAVAMKDRTQRTQLVKIITLKRRDEILPDSKFGEDKRYPIRGGKEKINVWKQDQEQATSKNKTSDNLIRSSVVEKNYRPDSRSSTTGDYNIDKSVRMGSKLNDSSTLQRNSREQSVESTVSVNEHSLLSPSTSSHSNKKQRKYRGKDGSSSKGKSGPSLKRLDDSPPNELRLGSNKITLPRGNEPESYDSVSEEDVTSRFVKSKPNSEETDPLALDGNNTDDIQMYDSCDSNHTDNSADFIVTKKKKVGRRPIHEFATINNAKHKRVKEMPGGADPRELSLATGINISTVGRPADEGKGSDEGRGDDEGANTLGRPKRQPKATQKLLESIESGSLGLMSMSKLVMEKMELKRIEEEKKGLLEKRDRVSTVTLVLQSDTAKEKKGKKGEGVVGAERPAADGTVSSKNSAEPKLKSSSKPTDEGVDSKKPSDVSGTKSKSTSHRMESTKRIGDTDMEYLEEDVSCDSEPESEETESAEEGDESTTSGNLQARTVKSNETSRKVDTADKVKPITNKVTGKGASSSTIKTPPINLSVQVKRGADASGLNQASPSKKMKQPNVGGSQDLCCCGATYRSLPELHLHLIKMTGSGDLAHRDKLIRHGFVCCTHCQVWIRSSMMTVHLQNIHNITSKTTSSSTLEIQKVVINLKKQTVPSKEKEIVKARNKKMTSTIEKVVSQEKGLVKQAKKGTGKTLKQKPVVNLGERIHLNNSEDSTTSEKNVVIVEDIKPVLRGILTNKNAATEPRKLNDDSTAKKKKKSVTLKSPNYKRSQAAARDDSSDTDFGVSDDEEDSENEASDSSSSRGDVPVRRPKKGRKKRSVSNIDEFDDEDEYYCPHDLKDSETLPISERSFQSSIENNSGKIKIKASLRSSRRSSSFTPLKPFDKGKGDRKNKSVNKKESKSALKLKTLRKNKKFSSKSRGSSSESSSSSEDQSASSEDELGTGESSNSSSEDEMPVRDKENIPLVDLEMYTFPSGNNLLTFLLVDPQNPRLKIYANMDSIFVSDPSLGDERKYNHQVSYLTENNNIIYVNPKHNLFPNVKDIENHIPQPIIVMKTAKLDAGELADKVFSPNRSVLKDANSNTLEGRFAVPNNNVSDLLAQIIQQKAAASAVASSGPNEQTHQKSSPSPSKKLREASRKLTVLMNEEEKFEKSEQAVDEAKPSQDPNEESSSDSVASKAGMTPKDLLAQLIDTTLNSSDTCFEKNMFLADAEEPDVFNEESPLATEVAEHEFQNVTTTDCRDQVSSVNLPPDQSTESIPNQYQLPPSKFSPSGQTVYIIRKANTLPQQKFVLSASGQTTSNATKSSESVVPRIVQPSKESVVPSTVTTVVKPIVIRTHSQPKSLSNSPVVTTFSTSQHCRDLIDMETLEPLNIKSSVTKAIPPNEHKDSAEKQDSAVAVPSTSSASQDLTSQPPASDVLMTSNISKAVPAGVAEVFSKPLSPLKSPLQEGASKVLSFPKKSAWSYLDDDSDEFLSTLEFTDHLQSPSHFESSDGNESCDALHSGGSHTPSSLPQSASQSYLPKVPSNLLDDVRAVTPASNKTQGGEGVVLDIKEVTFFSSPPHDGPATGHQSPSLPFLEPPSFTPRRSRRASLRTPDNKANAQEPLLPTLQFTPGSLSDLATPVKTPKNSSSNIKKKSPGLVTPPMKALPPPTFISPPSRKRLVNFDETEESSPGQLYSGLAYSCLSDNDIFGLWPGGASTSPIIAVDTSAASPKVTAESQQGTPIRKQESTSHEKVATPKNKTPVSESKRLHSEEKSPRVSPRKLNTGFDDDSTPEVNFNLVYDKNNPLGEAGFLPDELPDISGGSLQFDLDSIAASLDLQEAEEKSHRDLLVSQTHQIHDDSTLPPSIGKVIKDQSDSDSSEDAGDRHSAPPPSSHTTVPSHSTAGAKTPLVVTRTSPAKMASSSECFKRNRRKGDFEKSLIDHNDNSRDGSVSPSDAGFIPSEKNSPVKMPKLKLAVSFEDGSVPLEFSLDSFKKSRVLQYDDSHDENQQESVMSPTQSFSTTRFSSATSSENTGDWPSKQSTSRSPHSSEEGTLDMPTPLKPALANTNIHLGVTPTPRPVFSHLHQPLSSTPVNASTSGLQFTAHHEQYPGDSDDFGCISETEEVEREDAARHKKTIKHKEKRSKSKKKRREKSRSRSREGSMERLVEDSSLKLKINLKGMTSQMVTPECRKFKKYREKSKKRKHRDISDIMCHDLPDVESPSLTNNEPLHSVESTPIVNKNSSGEICTDIVQLVSEKAIRSPYEDRPSSQLQPSGCTVAAGPSKQSKTQSIKDYFTMISRYSLNDPSSFTLPDKSFYLGLERSCAFDDPSDEDAASDALLVSPRGTSRLSSVSREEVPPENLSEPRFPSQSMCEGVPDEVVRHTDDHPAESTVSEPADEVEQDSYEDLSQELSPSPRSSRCSRSKSREKAEEPQWHVAAGKESDTQTKSYLASRGSSPTTIVAMVTSDLTPNEQTSKVSSLTLKLSTSKRSDTFNALKNTLITLDHPSSVEDELRAAPLGGPEQREEGNTEESDSGVVSPRPWLQRGAKLRAAVLIQDQQEGITDSLIAGSLDVVHQRLSPDGSATSTDEKAHMAMRIRRNSSNLKVQDDGASGKRVVSETTQSGSEDMVTSHHRRMIGSPPRKISRTELLSPDRSSHQVSRNQKTSTTSRRRSSLLEIQNSPSDEAVLSPKRPLRIRRSSEIASGSEDSAHTPSASASSSKLSPTSDERTWHSRGAKLKAQVMISDQQSGIQDTSVVSAVEETLAVKQEPENYSSNDIRKFFKPKIAASVPSSTSSALTPPELRKERPPKSDIRTFFISKSPVQHPTESSSPTSSTRGKKRTLEDTFTEEDSDVDNPIDLSEQEEKEDTSSYPKRLRACLTDVNIPVSNLKLWYDLRCSRMAFVSGTLETAPGKFEGFPSVCPLSRMRAKAIRRCIAQLNMNWYKSHLFPVPLDHIINWNDEQLVAQLNFD